MGSASSLLRQRRCSFLGVERSIRRTGAGGGANVVDVEGLVAFAADHDCVHVMVACGVVKDDRFAFWAREPAVSPCGHCRQYRVGVATFVGEAVLVADWVLLVFDAAQ